MSGKPRDKRLWIKVLVDFVDHEKTLAAIDEGGGDAGWLWLKAMSWSRRKLSDGRLPHAVVRDLARFSKAKPEKLAAALVHSGLWEEVEGGYQIHDFAHFAPTKEQVEEKREASKGYMRTLREQKAASKAACGVHVAGNMPPTSDPQAATAAHVGHMFGPVTEVSEVSEVSDPPIAPQGAEERGALDVGLDPTESELFVSYAKGLSEATGTLAKPARTEANAYALTTLWGTVGYPDGYTAAEFLAKLPAKVGEYVAEARRRGQPDHFEGHFSPKRFLDFTQAVLAGRDPWPGLATSADGKPRQGGKAAGYGGTSSPYSDPTPAEIARMAGGAS